MFKVIASYATRTPAHTVVLAIMAATLHQIARSGEVGEGEDFFREATDSKGEQAANAVDGMQR